MFSRKNWLLSKSEMGTIWAEALGSLVYCFIASAVVASTNLAGASNAVRKIRKLS